MKQRIDVREPYELVLQDVDDPDARALVHAGIKSFNDAVSPHHRAVRPVGPRPLQLYLYAADGRVLGGLIAETYWNWLDVDDLWLDEAARGQGYGRVMLAAAEVEARARGCTAVQLKTFSFQARGFYEKQGYTVVGALAGYPPGATLYWMRKDLA